ncbi:protoporphyrinogen oxidase HemJ [Rhizobium sp. TRM95111]|uniref:protoporphyrinogen oxidase HemJ n=1 Tax=Rhizobium alarense TaxID=2846851 RepID=UPI001F484A42|nr:protoporphyrinogen oxidase HemJ [Rhizobium alarense]MCF3639969.1 protoporphyrinogen oxidase HemJ [Rhizobium alarense]
MRERQTDESPGRRARIRAATAVAIFCLVAAGLFVAPPDDLYLWAKALHLIAVISWMAGLLYLPRLFVYHTDHAPGSPASETFKVMEQRLYRVIMTPAMMLAWLLGLYLAWTVYGFHGGWLHAKLGCVVALTVVHVHFGRAVRAFAADANRRTGRQWRLWNEVPALLMIAIVILAVVKPI